MSGAVARLRGSSLPEPWIAAVAVAAAGSGIAMGLGGALAGDLRLGLGGVLLASAGLLVLLAAGWVDGLLLLVLALALPAPYASDTLRISAAAALTALLVFAWILRRGVDGGPIAWDALPLRSMFAVLIALTLAAGFSAHPMPAIRELTTFGLLLGLLAAATDELRGAPQRVHKLAVAVAAVMAIAGPLAALEAVGVLPGRFPLEGTSLYRATLGFGWPNELGMFFAVGLPLVVYAFQSSKGRGVRALAGLGALAAGLGLVATFSRGAWIATAVATLVLVPAGSPRFALRIWVFLGVGALLANVLTGGVLGTRIFALPGDWVVEQRAALLVVGLLMFREHPFLGVGPGGFAEELDRFGPQVSWLWDYIGDAHNAYVQMAAETGVIGLIAFLAFVSTTFVVLLSRARRAERSGKVSPEERALRRAFLWAFAAACAVSFTAWPFAHGVGQLIVLVAAGGFALGPVPEEES